MYFLVILLVTNVLLVDGRTDYEDEDRLWDGNSKVGFTVDMSSICINDMQTDIFLPFGMGIADASTVVISDVKHYPNCMITYCTLGGEHGIYLLVVVEFPDHVLGPFNVCQYEGSKLIIREPNKGDTDVCNEVNKKKFGYFATPIFIVLTNATNVSVILATIDLFETVKITATAARMLTQYEKCDKSKEITCTLENATVCISIQLLCDSNINCGTFSENDEDIRICDASRYKLLWLIVVISLVMVIILILFAIHLLKICLPSVPDSFFIFNEDEDNKLILSTQFVHPPEALRQPLPPKPQTQSAALYRFTSIPVSTSMFSGVTATPAKTYDKRTTFDATHRHSAEEEPEVKSHLYKKNTTKEAAEFLGGSLRKSEQVQEVKAYHQRKYSAKRPRFDVDDIGSFKLPLSKSYQRSGRPSGSAAKADRKSSADVQLFTE